MKRKMKGKCEEVETLKSKYDGLNAHTKLKLITGGHNSKAH